MNLVNHIRRRLLTRLTALHANTPAASPPFPMPKANVRRLRATWLPRTSQGPLRLHWLIDDSQKPPSRWRALLCFG